MSASPATSHATSPTVTCRFRRRGRGAWSSAWQTTARAASRLQLGTKLGWASDRAYKSQNDADVSSVSSVASSALSAANGAVSANTTQNGKISTLEKAVEKKSGKSGNIAWVRVGSMVTIWGSYQTTGETNITLPFTLPEEFRPASYIAAPTATAGSYISVSGAGKMIVTGNGGAHYFSMTYMAAS